MAEPSPSCHRLSAQRSRAIDMSHRSSRPAKVRRRMPSRISRRAPNSLYDILLRHSGTALFVRPVCWTDMHARLLGASFDELAPCDAPLPDNVSGSPPSRGHMRPSTTIVTLSQALTNILLPDAPHPILNAKAVKAVMSTLWPSTFGRSQLLPELHIFFGDRVYRDAVRTQVMWSYPDADARSSQSSSGTTSTDSCDTTTTQTSPDDPPSPPMMCYVGKNQLALMRRNIFRISLSPGRSWNGPVSRLQQLKGKTLKPANSNHDSHLVAIFLAMAQRHFYPEPPPSTYRDSPWWFEPGKPKRPPFEDIKLRILTHDIENSEFIVYTGLVTASFLDRFFDPARVPQHGDEDNAAPPGINIEYTKVPIWPILGLRERMGQALGQDIVGEFDPSAMETWEDDEDEPPPKNVKRKRETLSGVLNECFEDSTDGEQSLPPLPVKRRRLPEGGSAVGVVV